MNQRAELQVLRGSYATLSQREREVMALVVSGLLNKQVASELGISQITVKAHRGKVMRKMRAASLAAKDTGTGPFGASRSPRGALEVA